MDLDNYGCIVFSIAFLLMIIMKTITLLDIFLRKMINGQYNLDGNKQIHILQLINIYIMIKLFVD